LHTRSIGTRNNVFQVVAKLRFTHPGRAARLAGRQLSCEHSVQAGVSWKARRFAVDIGNHGVLTIPKAPTQNHQIRLEFYELSSTPFSLFAAMPGNASVHDGHTECGLQHLGPHVIVFNPPPKCGGTAKRQNPRARSWNRVVAHAQFIGGHSEGATFLAMGNRIQFEVGPNAPVKTWVPCIQFRPIATEEAQAPLNHRKKTDGQQG